MNKNTRKLYNSVMRFDGIENVGDRKNMEQTKDAKALKQRANIKLTSTSESLLRLNWNQKQPLKMKGRVRWNDANLREIEANKPVRKTIDEPKTPYPPTIEEDGSPTEPDKSVESTYYAAHAEALRNALNKLALSEMHNSPVGKWKPYDEEEQKDAVSFEDRRRAHYDEFKKVKESQEKDCFVDNEQDNRIHNSGSCSTSSINIAREIDIQDSDEILKIIDIEEDDDLSFPQYPHLLK